LAICKKPLSIDANDRYDDDRPRKLEPQVSEIVVFSVFEIFQGASERIKLRVALEQLSQAVCGGRRTASPLVKSSGRKANALVVV